MNTEIIDLLKKRVVMKKQLRLMLRKDFDITRTSEAELELLASQYEDLCRKIIDLKNGE